jgi:phosphoglycolate phosphatase
VQGYEAVVYDLDGTLVRLDVDWAAVTREVAGVLRARGIDASGDLWELLERAEGRAVEPVVEETIAEFEREGARSARRLPPADVLPVGVPTGVCSLNCEAACRIALELNGLDGHVDAIVGRDTLETHKPAPEGLLVLADHLGVDPGETLFVGDSETDARAAERAGLAFEWAADHR